MRIIPWTLKSQLTFLKPAIYRRLLVLNRSFCEALRLKLTLTLESRSGYKEKKITKTSPGRSKRKNLRIDVVKSTGIF